MPAEPREQQLDMSSGALPPRLATDLQQQNPWWSARPLPPLPAFKRWAYAPLLKRISREPPLARINVLRGPRQIGKTTLQFQLIEHLLKSGVAPERILRVQFDELPSFKPIAEKEPILWICEWFADRILGRDFNSAARDGKPAYLFLDEVQNLDSWAIQLKALVDRADVRAVVTGSSALRIELGRDSLAGRIETLEIGPFRLSEIAAVRGLGELPAFQSGNGWGAWSKQQFWLELQSHGRKHAVVRDKAYAAFSERGGYPLAQRADIEWPDVARQLNETVVKRVIQHDLRIGERGRRRDPQLLEEMFRMAARYCGQAPGLSELARQARESLDANVGVQRVRTYLDFLDSSLLIRAIGPLEMRLKKRRNSPKLCLSDHVLRAAWLDEVVPLDPKALEAAPELADLAGRIAESTAGYFFASAGIPVAHLPARRDSPEVDFVLTAGDHRVPVEIKYQRRIDPLRDSRGLVEFLRNPVNRAKIGVIVTRVDSSAQMPNGIISVPLKSLLLAR
jgi:hypothetical protein